MRGSVQFEFCRLFNKYLCDRYGRYTQGLLISSQNDDLAVSNLVPHTHINTSKPFERPKIKIFPYNFIVIEGCHNRWAKDIVDFAYEECHLENGGYIFTVDRMGGEPLLGEKAHLTPEGLKKEIEDSDFAFLESYLSDVSRGECVQDIWGVAIK